MTYHKRRHRGLALLLVLTVVALASVVGLSILSSASLHAKVGSNTAKAAAAEYLSESAAQTAIFFLQNPSLMPASWSAQAGYAIYADHLMVSGLDGSFDLRVKPTAVSDLYEIQTTGRSQGDAPVTRVATVKVKAVRANPGSAAAFGGGVQLPPRHTFNGDLIAAGAVVPLGATINGTVQQSYASDDFIVPTAATINYYGAGAVPGTYTLPDGTTGTPQAVSGTITAFPAASGTNPGNVYYCNGDLTVNATTPIAFNGTLVVLGHLTVQGTNFTITPIDEMPALITTGQLRLFWKNMTFRVNGLAWVGGGTAWTGGMNTTSFIVIDGALMMPSGVGLGSTTTGIMTVTFSANNANVASLTTSGLTQPIKGVRLLDWRQ